MSNIKKRLERLERARPKGVPVIIIKPGESKDEVWKRYLAEHPEHEGAKVKIVINLLAPGPPLPPPPPMPEPEGRPRVRGPGPLKITK